MYVGELRIGGHNEAKICLCRTFLLLWRYSRAPVQRRGAFTLTSARHRAAINAISSSSEPCSSSDIVVLRRRLAARATVAITCCDGS